MGKLAAIDLKREHLACPTYIEPAVMRDYCMFDHSSRGMGFGAIVSGTGGQWPSDEWGPLVLHRMPHIWVTACAP